MLKNNKHLLVGKDNICPTAALINAGQILLGFRNYILDNGKKFSVWTTPGGRCKSGEKIKDTLQREIEEETGISNFEIIDFIGEVPGAEEGDIVPIFYCTTSEEAQLKEPEKFSEWKWIPIKEYSKGKPWNLMNPKAHELICNFLLKS